MTRHRSALPAQVTLLKSGSPDGPLPVDNANSLARLFDALASVPDLVSLCTVLQAELPRLVGHEWAALLFATSEPHGWCWQIDPPTPVERQSMPDAMHVLIETPQLLYETALRHAPDSIKAALQPLTALEGRFAIVPLLLSTGPAVLCLGSAHELAWTEAETQTIQTCSSVLKLALQHVLLTDQMQRLERHTQALEAIRSTIAHTLDLNVLLRQVVEQVALRYGYSLVSLYMVEGDMLHCKHQVGYFNVIRRIPVTTGIMAQAFRQRQTICVPNVRFEPEFIAALTGVVSEIAVPLQSEQTVYGVLNVESRDRQLGPFDQSLLDAVSSEASVAIERAQLYTATHRQAQQLTMIEQLRSAIASQLDIDALGATIVRLLRDQLRFEFVSLLLLQDDALNLRAWCGDYYRLRTRMSLDQGLNGLCIRRREPLLIQNVQSEPEYVSVAQNVRSGIYLPLIYEQTVLGTLCIESRATLTTSDFEIVTSLREQIAAALEQSRRLEIVQRAREREAFLNKLLATINQTSLDHWQDIWAQLGVQLTTLLEGDLCAIGLFEADQTMTLNVWRAQRDTDNDARSRQIHLSAFDPQRLERFRRGECLYVRDVTRYEEPSALQTVIIEMGAIALAAVPVIVEKTLVALLAVTQNQPRHWEDHDKALLESVAQHLAVAHRQAILWMQEEQRRQELELVYQIALDINAHHDLEPVLQAIVDRACRLLNADCAALYLLLPNEAEAELRVGVNNLANFVGSRVRRTQGMVGRSLEATHSFLVEDYHSWPRRDQQFNFMALRATLGMPLIAGNRTIGTLIVAHTRADKRFSATDQRLIEMLGAQAAQAIETAQLLEDVRRRSAEMEAVYANVLTLLLDLDLQQVLQSIVERAQSLIGSTNAGLHILDPVTQELELTVAVNMAEHLLHTRVMVGEGVVGRVAQTRQSIRLDNYQTWPDPAEVYEHLPWFSVMAVPLLSGDQLLGVIGMAHTDADRRFTLRDQQLMELFASQAAQAVEQARRFERERILRSDAERSLQEMQAVLQELEQTNERVGRLEKMRLLGELASEVAHDFNNALTSMLGNSQLLLLDETDPSRIETLSAIEAAARDSAAMIKRLQEFGRPQHGPYTEVVDINSIVRDALLMTQRRWRELVVSSIRLEASYPIRGSATELRRVLMNLIVNALDAMPDGGTLEIVTEDVADAVRIVVTDSGIGMLPDVQARVFDPFFTTKAFGMGTGLGLSICHQIVVRHGGTISVVSEPEFGTTFSILLPASIIELGGMSAGEP
jgi:GAF domain-containing protein